MTDPIRIAILDDYIGAALATANWSSLPSSAEVTVFRDRLENLEELAEQLAPFHVIVAMRERTAFPASLLGRLSNLELLVTTGMRNSAIDVEAADAIGIPVCGTRSDPLSTVELTWALILGVSRNLITESENIRAGEWQSTLGTRLAGKTLGVIGLGRIGSRVAHIAHALDMRVIAWSENLTLERATEVGADLTPSLGDLLARSDVVSIHLALSSRTVGLLGATEISMMKASAILINTSRGPIVNNVALVRALSDGAIKGAAIDVFDHEPPSADHPLRSASNALATPHIGYVTRESLEVFYGDAVENISNYLQGRLVRPLTKKPFRDSRGRN